MFCFTNRIQRLVRRASTGSQTRGKLTSAFGAPPDSQTQDTPLTTTKRGELSEIEEDDGEADFNNSKYVTKVNIEMHPVDSHFEQTENREAEESDSARSI